MGSEDKTITCIDCDEPFVWSEGDQRFYQQREYSPPKRCGPCRMEKRERRERETAAR